MIEQEKPILIYKKSADKIKNRIGVPKTFVDKYGYEFSMEVYKDKIVLIPIKEEE